MDEGITVRFVVAVRFKNQGTLTPKSARDMVADALRLKTNGHREDEGITGFWINSQERLES